MQDFRQKGESRLLQIRCLNLSWFHLLMLMARTFFSEILICTNFQKFFAIFLNLHPLKSEIGCHVQADLETWFLKEGDEFAEAWNLNGYSEQLPA